MRAASLVARSALVCSCRFCSGSSGPISSPLLRSMRRPRSASALCWGQAGFLPLGQAMFFGLAAYLSGLAFIAFQDSSDCRRSDPAACRHRRRPARLSDRLTGVSAFGRERRLFLDDHARARAAGLPDRHLLEFESPAASTGSRAFPVCPASTTSPTSTMSRRAILLAVLAFRRLALQRADRRALAGAGAERASAAVVRLRYQSAQGRGVRHQRIDGRRRRRDLCAATRASSRRK